MKYKVIIDIIFFTFFIVSCDLFHDNTNTYEHYLDNKKAKAEIVDVIPTKCCYVLCVNDLLCFSGMDIIDDKLWYYWTFFTIQDGSVKEEKTLYHDATLLFPQSDKVEYWGSSNCSIIDNGEKYIFLMPINTGVLRPILDQAYYDWTLYYYFFEMDYDGSNLCFSDITNDLIGSENMRSMYYDNDAKILYTVHFDETSDSIGKQILSRYSYDELNKSYSLLNNVYVDKGYKVTKGGGYIYKNEDHLYRLFLYKGYSCDNPFIVTLNYLDVPFESMFYSAFFDGDYVWMEHEAQKGFYPDSYYNLVKLKLLDISENPDCCQPECVW